MNDETMDFTRFKLWKLRVMRQRLAILRAARQSGIYGLGSLAYQQGHIAEIRRTITNVSQASHPA